MAPTRREGGRRSFGSVERVFGSVERVFGSIEVSIGGQR
jgi:hypothetical protein